MKSGQHMTVGSGDSSVKLDDSFEDLGDDMDYKEFHKIVEAGFEEITQEEINKVPEPVKLPKYVVDFKLLIQAERFDFRNHSKLKRMIEKEFINGLSGGPGAVKTI